MPFGDRTGPRGQGPMTGRRMGYCAGYSSPGWKSSAFGKKDGFKRGRRGGYRNWYRATGLTGWQRNSQGMPAWGGQRPAVTASSTRPQEKEALKQEKEMLSSEVKNFKKQIENIEERLEDL